MSEFEPIEQIWNLQNLKNREKKLRYELYAMFFVMAVNLQVFIGSALTKTDSLLPAETFFVEATITAGLAILQDETKEKIEQIENFIDSLDDKKRGNKVQPPQTLIEIESENQIIKA